MVTDRLAASASFPLSPTSSPVPDMQGGGGAAPRRGTYETQKRRDWHSFGQYLRNRYRPPLEPARSSGAHVLDYLRYLDQFGKTKVHAPGCPFYGHPSPPALCPCPLQQAWRLEQPRRARRPPVRAPPSTSTGACPRLTPSARASCASTSARSATARPWRAASLPGVGRRVLLLVRVQ